ncbi:type II secretion system protein [Longibacter salinarum]|uniref:Type II secretion system protein n=1 Tax=Longibacter salinarum TaxID=1850348 RepID=A0A2A8CU29_9BACT|nr:type II secretion system F family protein [Longibacter salinarum]PEN11378.1 type II secretion system protein [Longibacter salinarum]
MAVREYRFSGVNTLGEPVRGTVFAPSKRAANKRIDDLSDKHSFRTDEVEQRRTYRYKVRDASGSIASGEQKAYNPNEVRAALERMGLEVVKVERKLLDFQMKPSSTDIVMFVRLAANMLRRQLPFDEILTLLAADSSSKPLRQMMRDLQSDLKSGMNAQNAFMKHQHVLGKFTAYMLGLAASSGNMAAMFESTARYLERKDEFRKSVRSALITPAITLIATIAAFVWYIWYIIPAYAGLFADYNITLPPLTQMSLDFASWMDANWIWVTGLLLLITIAGVAWSRTTRGRFIIHKYMIQIPVLGSLLHKLNLEVFCRVFAVLYSGAGENEEVMKIAAEATGNSYIEHQVKTITVPMMMARGTDLIEAMQASGVFTRMTIARFRSGSETGAVRESAEEMAEFYEKETTLKLEQTVETIKTGVAIIISLMVGLLTVISAESALIQPSSSDIMFQR